MKIKCRGEKRGRKKGGKGRRKKSPDEEIKEQE